MTSSKIRHQVIKDYTTEIVKSLITDEPKIANKDFFATIDVYTKDVEDILKKYFKVYRPNQEIEKIDFKVNFDSFTGCDVHLAPISDTFLINEESTVTADQTAELHNRIKSVKFKKIMKFTDQDLYNIITLYFLETAPNVQVLTIHPKWTAKSISILLYKKMILEKFELQVKTSPET